MLFLHAQDLLDQRIIEHGGFVPLYTKGDVNEAISEIVELQGLTLTETQLKIEYKTSTDSLDEMKFDRRRL